MMTEPQKARTTQKYELFEAKSNGYGIAIYINGRLFHSDIHPSHRICFEAVGYKNWPTNLVDPTWFKNNEYKFPFDLKKIEFKKESKNPKGKTTKRKPKGSKNLQEQFPGEIVLTKDLRSEHLVALAWYMAIDGVAWELDISTKKIIYGTYVPNWDEKIKQSLRENLKHYREKYGSQKYGVTWIKTETLIHATWEIPEIKIGHPTPESYRKEILDGSYGLGHNLRKVLWPVILDSTPGETLQDGWNRFYYYVAKGVKKIPAIYYPKTMPAKSKKTNWTKSQIEESHKLGWESSK